MFCDAQMNRTKTTSLATLCWAQAQKNTQKMQKKTKTKRKSAGPSKPVSNAAMCAND